MAIYLMYCNFVRIHETGSTGAANCRRLEQLVRVHVKAAHHAQHRPPYAVYDDRFEVDPASGSAWTKAGVDTLQAGVEVVA